MPRTCWFQQRELAEIVIAWHKSSAAFPSRHHTRSMPFFQLAGGMSREGSASHGEQKWYTYFFASWIIISYYSSSPLAMMNLELKLNTKLVSLTGLPINTAWLLNFSSLDSVSANEPCLRRYSLTFEAHHSSTGRSWKEKKKKQAQITLDHSVVCSLGGCKVREWARYFFLKKKDMQTKR